MKVMVYLGKKVFQLQQLWSAKGTYVSVCVQASYKRNLEGTGANFFIIKV